MLKKTNRVDKKNIDLIFKEGKFVNSPNLTFKFLLSPIKNPPRISFIAPKSVAKLAVKRNKLRRLGYTALNRHINQFPKGILGAFIFRKSEDDTSILESEIKNVLSKIN